MLDDIFLFIQLYDIKSFKTCAELLNIKASTLSKHITALEDKLNKQLIVRTSRIFQPTEDGIYIYNHFKHIFDYSRKILNIPEKVEIKQEPGVLNVSLGSAISYELISPLIDNFTQSYPNIKLQINYSVNVNKWPSKETNIILTTNTINDNKLRNHFLRKELIRFYCRPQYILNHGYPETPNELVNHKIICGTDNYNKKIDYITLSNYKTTEKFLLDLSNNCLTVNNFLHMRKIGLETNYIFASLDSLCHRDLINGDLVIVLPEWHVYALDYYMITKQKTTPLEKAFINFIHYCMSRLYNKTTLDSVAKLKYP